MSDEEVILFAQFICDRFAGFVPDNRMLTYALQDWKTEMNNEYKGQEDG